MSVSPQKTELIVDWFDVHGPASYHELAAGTGFGHDYARYLCNQLAKEGFLRRAGKRKAKTRPQTLWDLT